MTDSAHEAQLENVRRDVREHEVRVDRRVTQVERAVDRICESVEKISDTLTEFAVLSHQQMAIKSEIDQVRTEVKEANAELNATLKATNKKVEDIQIAMPGLKEKTGWMTALAGLIIVFVVGALLALVVTSRAPGLAP